VLCSWHASQLKLKAEDHFGCGDSELGSRFHVSSVTFGSFRPFAIVLLLLLLLLLPAVTFLQACCSNTSGSAQLRYRQQLHG
jgi:hypothetical protein